MAEKNIDIALESSVQSVLNIVGDMKSNINTNNSKALNELIEDYGDTMERPNTGMSLVRGSFSAETNKTILSVNGSGRLYGAVVRNTHNLTKPTKIEIIADGVTTTFSITPTSTTNTGEKMIYVGHPKYIFYHGSELYFFGCVGSPHRSYKNSLFTEFTPFTTYNMSISSEGGLGCLLESHIEFKSSLIVTITTTGNVANYCVGYSID